MDLNKPLNKLHLKIPLSGNRFNPIFENNMASERSDEEEPLIIVILGCTGTGKSKLSLEIGRRINGEIISSDSMQVYKGLDIITNKVTKEEQDMIPHHLLDFVEASERFSVVEFKAIALDVISNILARQKVPIIVGGTNYYIESLLWENLIDEKKVVVRESDKEREKLQKVENERAKEGELVSNSNQQPEKVEQFQTDKESLENLRQREYEKEQSVREIHTENTNESFVSDLSRPVEDVNIHNSLHQRLSEVDFVMAQKLHPNDTRKIKRSLEVFENSGITHSDHIAQQQSQEGSSPYSGPMRFKNVCVLWLQCNFETLDKRLDARVDQMIEQGLLKELLEFHNSWKSESTNSKMLNNEGIFQSIGFKEFREFLDGGSFSVGAKPELFQRCVEAMKCATRRYARKQVRWVKNRFLGRPCTSSPDVYGLDATDVELWKNNVLEKALSIVEAFKRKEKVPYAPLVRTLSSPAAKHSNHTCTMCGGRVIIGDQNWEAHLHSRSHRYHKKKQQRVEEDSI